MALPIGSVYTVVVYDPKCALSGSKLYGVYGNKKTAMEAVKSIKQSIMDEIMKSGSVYQILENNPEHFRVDSAWYGGRFGVRIGQFKIEL